MAGLPYPPEDLNRGAKLLDQLGSFWATIFDDRYQLQTHLRSGANEQAQTHLDFLAAVACVSRFTVPVFHRKYWHLLIIKQSEVNSVPSIHRPGDLVYGPQSGAVPGRPAGFIQKYGARDRLDIVQARLPDNMVNAQYMLQNYVVNASRTLVCGTDYDVDKERKLIRFLSDPFQDPLIPKRDVYDAAGNVTDAEMALWAYFGDFDLNLVYTQFGYALGLVLGSSQGYKDLLNAFWDAHVLGLTMEAVQRYLAALSDAPLVNKPVEVVEVVRAEADSKLICTDLSVYRVPLAANVAVAVGQTVYAGDPLTDAVQVLELSRNDADYSSLHALTLSRNLLSGEYYGELTFHNRRVDLEYLGLDQDNKAVVRFEITGFPADVDKFWEDAQTRGKEAGRRTLAEMLDTRENPVGQPVPLNLPAQVNPLEFVLDNLLRNNLFVIRVRQSSFGPNQLGLNVFRHLRRVVPPHTTYVVFVELTPLSNTIDLGQAGGEDEPGVNESAGVFRGAAPLVEALTEGTDYADAAVSTRLVAEYGQ
jgi:hypothetical protein